MARGVRIAVVLDVDGVLDIEVEAELTAAVGTAIAQTFPARLWGVDFRAWGGGLVKSVSEISVQFSGAAGAGSEVDGVRAIFDEIGVRVERPVVVEGHRLGRRYPEPLVSGLGVRVRGFVVSAAFVQSRDPESAAAFGPRDLELLGDVVENAVRGADAEAARVGQETNGESGHESSSRDSRSRCYAPGLKVTVEEGTDYSSFRGSVRVDPSGQGGSTQGERIECAEECPADELRAILERRLADLARMSGGAGA